MVCSRSRLAWLAAIIIGALCLSAYGQDEPVTEPSSSTSSTSDFTLPRKMFVSLGVVKQFFPAVTRQYSPDSNSTAVGKPQATRMVIFSTNDGSKRVTLSVADYDNPGDASSAYQQAAQKSQLPEFNPIAVSNVGQQVFAGTVAQGTQTQVSLTALDGTLIVGATLAGFDATTENIGKLAELARKEVSEAKTHARRRR